MGKYSAKIYVTLREGVNDPQGYTVKESLNRFGYESLLNLRIGKYIEAEVEAEDAKTAETFVRDICDKVLANPVIEDFRVHISKSGM